MSRTTSAPRERTFLCRWSSFRSIETGLLEPAAAAGSAISKPGRCGCGGAGQASLVARGHLASLIETLVPWAAVPSTPSPIRTLDLGCGEGSFAPALFPGCADGYCGIDLSKRAIKLAARCWPPATWVLANADRILPAADASVHRIVSLFGRRPVAEIRRVLAPQGTCIVAVPGENDLIELRQLVQQAGHRRSRWELVAEEMASAGLECIEQKHWQRRVELEPSAIVDALEMTYRAGRRSRQSRLDSLSTMKVTLAADLVLLRRS